MTSRVWGAAIAAAALASACTSAPVADKPKNLAADYAADAKAMCELVPKVYAFYAERAAHWPEACEQAQVEAKSITTPRQGTTMLEHLVEALWDNHASLGVNTGISPWLVPSGSDMWVEQQGEGVVVTGVRRGGAAEWAGIRPGFYLQSINGVNVRDAALARIRAGREDVTPAHMAWALNAAVAGYRGQARKIFYWDRDVGREVTLGDPAPPKSEDPVSTRMIGEIGYIRFNDSLGSDDTVAAFDAAVETMKAAKGWIIDVRNTASGGSTDVAEPIMGRFVTQAADYQITRPLHEPAYARQIEPRGPWTLTGPLVVLSGRWTGSMGEGMTIGFDGMKRGTVVGGPMAGLAGGVEVFNLPATDTNLRLPAYGLTHIDGTPRQVWSPKERVQPDAGGAEDPALARALEIVGGK